MFNIRCASQRTECQSLPTIYSPQRNWQEGAALKIQKADFISHGAKLTLLGSS